MNASVLVDVGLFATVALFIGVGLGMVALGILNLRYDINRRWARHLNAVIFGDSRLRRFGDLFADSRLGRACYGPLATIILVLCGVIFLIALLASVIASLR
jgi:hypothetical protein